MATVWLVFLRREKYFLFEAYLLVRIIALGIMLFTVGLLIQDKMCVNVYHQSAEFCQHIHEVATAKPETLVKDRILADTAQFSNYRNLIQAIPMILWSLFVGSFLDRYQGATRLLFLLGNLFDQITLVFYIVNAYFFSLSPYYLLISSGVAFFTGDMISFLTAANRYIILNTDRQQRATKFVIFQSVLFISFALGTFIGGHLLVFQTQQKAQLRNYGLCFVVSSALNLASIVVLFLLKWDVSYERPGEETIINHDIEDQEDEEESLKRTDSNHNLIEEDENENPTPRKPNIFRTLLNLRNFKDTIHCLVRERDGNQRVQLLLLNAIILIAFFVGFGIDAIFMQFTEKAYHWSSQTYSTVNAFTGVTVNLTMMLLSYLLVTRMKISDGVLLVHTLPFGVITYSAIGTFLDPLVFLLTIPLKAISSLSSVVVKSKLSKMISSDEVGKIFSLISTMEAIMPFLGSFVFTKIFSATVSTYPGAIYQVCGGFTLLALIIAVVQELFYS